MSNDAPMKAALPASVKSYARYLLIMAGLGGLLYGVDVGIIAAALPYIQDTSSYTESQLSQVVAAVLFGSVLSSLFAGVLSDIFGRKPVIILSALLFTLSIPVICLSDGSFSMLMGGRILQGASAGLVGVVVPLYLAECLGADARGKGTGMFQFLLTVGLVFAALIGLFTAQHVDSVVADPEATKEIVTSTKAHAWQVIFWVSMVPGIILFFGAFRLSESPRWLFRRGRKDEALASLARNNGEENAQAILKEMEETEEEERRQAEAKKAAKQEAKKGGDSILQRKYVIPFILAVVILACNQATGINSVLNYSVKVFQQAGLEGTYGNWADLSLKIANCVMTVVAVALVDKKGRKFLLKLGTSGVIVGLAGAATLFLTVEKERKDVTAQVQAMLKDDASKLNVDLADTDVQKKLGLDSITPGTQLIVTYKYKEDGESLLTVGEFFGEQKYADAKKTQHNPVFAVYAKDKQDLAINKATWKTVEGTEVDVTEQLSKKVKDGGVKVTLNDVDFLMEMKLAADKKAAQKLAETNDTAKAGQHPTLAVSYKQGDVEKTEEIAAAPFQGVSVTPGIVLEPSSFGKWWDDMWGKKQTAKPGDLKTVEVVKAELGQKPSATTGWLVTLFFVVFIAFYAVGPGVCVWLALSELMPTRIRSNGMAIALLINQGVSTVIAGTFLPWVSAWGYSGVFYTLAGFTVIYFITAAFFLPETKGRTLEEIEEYFTNGKMPDEKKA